MKKTVITAAFIFILTFSLAVGIKGDKVYSFDLSESLEKPEGAYGEFIDSIPDEIKKELPSSANGEELMEYDFSFFFEKIKESLKNAVAPVTKTISSLCVIIIISSLFSVLSSNVTGEGMRDAFSFCSSLCVALSIFGSMQTVFKTVESLLKVLSETMLIMIPVMEAVYIRSGNLTGASVTSTGINLMISFTQSLFVKVLEPCIYAVFVLSIVSSVTKNVGIMFMSKSLKGIVASAVLIIMTLMSFVLSMQANAASAVDTFGVKTVKFAIGNYFPIVGAPLADSFSLLSGSLGVIKQSCGVIGIASLLVAFFPPFAVILFNRMAVGLAGAAASTLGCKRESELLDECKVVCTLLVAVVSGAVVMYIIAIGIFIKTPLAVA